MRRILIAGNWKMNGQRADLEVAEAISKGADAHRHLDVLICPPATLIAPRAERIRSSALKIGGQTCHANASGAHTGDISAQMLADAGARYVIVGHSERRADHGETSLNVRAQAEAALLAGLIPLICVGETEAERDSGNALTVVCDQLATSLPEAAIEGKHGEIVVAYEPVWAIGTGRTPTSAQVQDMHAALRATLHKAIGQRANTVRILYGGSMKPENAEELLEQKDVDGGLVGGASLSEDDFNAILAAAPRSPLII
jgi:triosephosphate isomerase